MIKSLYKNILLTTLLIILIVFGYYFILSKPVTKEQTNEEKILLNQNLSDLKENQVRELLAQLNENISSESYISYNNFEWWKDNNGELMPLKSLKLRLLPVNTINTTDDLEVAYSTINNFFNNHDFTINELNTDVNNGIFYFYAYEKSDLYCTLTLYPNSSEVGQVSCGWQDDGLTNIIKEFKEIFNDYSNENLIFNVSQIIDNSATGQVGFWHTPSGSIWIAVKENNNWKKIYSGQDYPPCQTMDEYKIPASVYHNCMEDSSSVRFKNER